MVDKKLPGPGKRSVEDRLEHERMRVWREIEAEAARCVEQDLSPGWQLLGHSVTVVFDRHEDRYRAFVESEPELEATGSSRTNALASLAERLTLPDQEPS